MAKKSTTVVNLDTEKLTRLAGRIRAAFDQKKRCKEQIGGWLIEAMTLLKAEQLWVKWLETEFLENYGFNVRTAYRYMELYREAHPADLQTCQIEKRGRPRTSGSAGSAGPSLRQRGGGGKSAAVDAPPAVAPPPSSSLPTVPAPVLHIPLNDLQAALQRAARAEATNAKLLLENETLEAKIDALEARIDRHVDEIRELKAARPAVGDQITAIARTRKDLDDGRCIKEMERLKADNADLQATLERARTPTPAGYANMFMLLPDKDQAAIIREIADTDAAAPGEYDIYRVKFIEILFAKIHHQNHRNNVLNKLKPPVLPVTADISLSPVKRGTPAKLSIPPRRFPNDGAM